MGLLIIKITDRMVIRLSGQKLLCLQLLNVRCHFSYTNQKSIDQAILQ